MKGKIVVCKRGINARMEKGIVVKAADGAGMLLLNNPIQGEELVADPHVLPSALLGASAGKAIQLYLKQDKNLTGSISFHGTTYGSRAPMIASFSSRGPSPTDPHVIKPDVPWSQHPSCMASYLIYNRVQVLTKQEWNSI